MLGDMILSTVDGFVISLTCSKIISLITHYYLSVSSIISYIHLYLFTCRCVFSGDSLLHLAARGDMEVAALFMANNGANGNISNNKVL